jgi:hypothetical protein
MFCWSISCWNLAMSFKSTEPNMSSLQTCPTNDGLGEVGRTRRFPWGVWQGLLPIWVDMLETERGSNLIAERGMDSMHTRISSTTLISHVLRRRTSYESGLHVGSWCQPGFRNCIVFIRCEVDSLTTHYCLDLCGFAGAKAFPVQC